jgi:hypothetical protein
MRGLEREEEDLEDAVSHLSIYLNGLDHLVGEDGLRKPRPRPARMTISARA